MICREAFERSYKDFNLFNRQKLFFFKLSVLLIDVQVIIKIKISQTFQNEIYFLTISKFRFKTVY